MATLLKIATCSSTADLIITSQLQGAYARVSIPKLRETAIRSLFEELFNEYFRSTSLSIYDEQQLNESFQAVDVAVEFHDRQAVSNLIFVLLTEIKRHKITDRDELESQLQKYDDRYLNTSYERLAMHHTVYETTAYEIKIRFFRFTRENEIFQDEIYSRDLHAFDEKIY
ncbi:hypothetical protein FQN54_004889 [Arachnomyces sp. PD_36]|nr:hypothetical protein FQN54_004889 [Arachnomyces sp. PD_36]